MSKLKCSPPATSPQRQRSVAAFGAERVRTLHQQPEDSDPVIAGEIDQFRLRDEPAKLDQLPCPLASFHNPRTRVTARPRRQ